MDAFLREERHELPFKRASGVSLVQEHAGSIPRKGAHRPGSASVALALNWPRIGLLYSIELRWITSLP
jgi:hypothetical protein